VQVAEDSEGEGEGECQDNIQGDCEQTLRSHSLVFCLTPFFSGR
jgi:hypothetical protein